MLVVSEPQPVILPRQSLAQSGFPGLRLPSFHLRWVIRRYGIEPFGEACREIGSFGLGTGPVCDVSTAIPGHGGPQGIKHVPSFPLTLLRPRGQSVPEAS